MGINERKKREKQERREMILKAAKEIFMLHGYKLATIEEIAAKAELSPATIYLYFKNKDELYVTLNLSALQFLFDRISNVYLKKSLSPLQKILEYKRVMYEYFRDDPLRLRVIFHTQLEDTLLLIDKELLVKMNKLSQKTMTIIAETYKEGVRKKEFEDGHEMAHADIMWATFAGLVLWEEAKRKINPKKDFLKPTLDRAFDIFCRGIRRNKVFS